VLHPSFSKIVLNEHQSKCTSTVAMKPH